MITDHIDRMNRRRPFSLTRAQSTIGRCKIHQFSVWDEKFERCFMGNQKNEQCEVNPEWKGV